MTRILKVDLGEQEPSINDTGLARLPGERDRVCYEFGLALSLFAGSDRKRLSLGSLNAHLLPPIRLKQRHFIFGPKRVPLAWASWAYVSERTADRLSHDSSTILLLPDWNDGSRLWLTDFFAIEHRARQLIAELSPIFAHHHGEITYRRRGKVVTRRLRRQAP